MRLHSIAINGITARKIGPAALLDLMMWIDAQFIGDGYETEKLINRDATLFRRKRA